jgi:hypothetical protein
MTFATAKNYFVCWNMALAHQTLFPLWQTTHASFDNLNSHSHGHVVPHTKQVLGWFRKQSFTEEELKSLFKHGDGAP